MCFDAMEWSKREIAEMPLLRSAFILFFAGEKSHL